MAAAHRGGDAALQCFDCFYRVKFHIAVYLRAILTRMNQNQPALLVPVENQVRELDAKLLLACIAAQRGISSILGPKREMEFRIASYLCVILRRIH